MPLLARSLVVFTCTCICSVFYKKGLQTRLEYHQDVFGNQIFKDTVQIGWKTNPNRCIDTTVSAPRTEQLEEFPTKNLELAARTGA